MALAVHDEGTRWGAFVVGSRRALTTFTGGGPCAASPCQDHVAIVGTSANTNGIATLDTVPGDPPTFADYEALRAKVNELILNGRRP